MDDTKMPSLSSLYRVRANCRMKLALVQFASVNLMLRQEDESSGSEINTGSGETAVQSLHEAFRV
jgi:hypothetical protein